ncbi:MAG: hypothetical protein OCD02_16425 [Spirochaetaceae bacterium]
MKNFIDFIADAAKDTTIGEELLKVVDSSDHKTVASWFQDKGYDVSEDDSKKLVDNKEDMKTTKIGFYY